jgi:toxin ParE1/3/4
MTVPVRLRSLAASDVDAVVRSLRSEAGGAVAERFVDDLEREMRRLATHPALGSLRLAYELAIPGLRLWPLRDFPFVITYVETADAVDVWRVLHTRRDIGGLLS